MSDSDMETEVTSLVSFVSQSSTVTSDAIKQLYRGICEPATSDSSFQICLRHPLQTDRFEPIQFESAALDSIDRFKKALFEAAGLGPPPSTHSATPYSQLFAMLYIRTTATEQPIHLVDQWKETVGFLPPSWMRLLNKVGTQAATSSRLRTLAIELNQHSAGLLPSIAYRVIPVKNASKMSAVSVGKDIVSDERRSDDMPNRPNTLEYLQALQQHVQTGSSVGGRRRRFFISATTNLNTALWHSKAGMLAIVEIDLAKCDIVFRVGEHCENLFRAAMAKNFAQSSSEVVIDSVVPVTAYRRVHLTPVFQLQRYDLVSSASRKARADAYRIPDFDPTKLTAVEELKGTTRPVKARYRHADAGTDSYYVIKMGPHHKNGKVGGSYEQMSRHLLDEFFAFVVYDCAGANVPSCSLQLVALDATIAPGVPLEEVRGFGPTLMWVLLVEFIDGDVQSGRDAIKDRVLLQSLGDHVMLDLVMHNLDCVGEDFSNVIFRTNDITRSHTVFRIDCGACFGNHADKEMKTDRRMSPDKLTTQLYELSRATKSGRPSALTCLGAVYSTKPKDKNIGALENLKRLPTQLHQRILRDKLSDNRFLACRQIIIESLDAWLRHLTNEPLVVQGLPDNEVFVPADAPVPSLERRVRMRTESNAGSGSAELGADNAIERDSSRPRKGVGTIDASIDAAAATAAAANGTSTDSSRRERKIARPRPTQAASKMINGAASTEDRIFVVGHRTRMGEGTARDIDVTSKAPEPFCRFSPFYPHGGVPVPFIVPATTSESVEGVWQGLKVFERQGIEVRKFRNRTMKNLKRTETYTIGRIRGHFAGNDRPLLDYVNARKEIYLPTYEWLLENRLQADVQLLIDYLRANDSHTIKLYDFYVNGNVNDTSKPLSHAALLKAHIVRKMKSSTY